ncbi:MAG: DoxX family protein [Gemmatimonadetes bacterium]|nr:DoxX family protein [Gemmatimonadota bacterium]
MSIALLIARVLLGLGIAAHGAQKLFGWFGGYGLGGTAGFFETLGFRPGRSFAAAAGLAEFGGGVLTAAGLLGPIGPALVILVMIVAMVAVHASHGFFVTNNGIEVPLLYAIGNLVLAFTGPGSYSLDAMLGLLTPSTATYASIAAGLAVLGAVAVLALRRRADPNTLVVH